MSDYIAKAKSDAADTVLGFEDEILEQLLDKGEASDDLLNDYVGGDSYHHENHVDKSYYLTEAAELIDQLPEHEETDSGLWEGQQPKEAIGTCAAFTYGNAVYHYWSELIKEINDRAESIVDDSNEAQAVIEDELEFLDPDDPAETASIDGKKAELEDLRQKQVDDLHDLIEEIAANA
jgi:hypothetical protein